MTENKQNNNDRTDRRPDCVTEIRMGNTVLVVSGFFKKDTTATAGFRQDLCAKLFADSGRPEVSRQ